MNAARLRACVAPAAFAGSAFRWAAFAFACACALALAPPPAAGAEADPWGGMRAAGESPKATPAPAASAASGAASGSAAPAVPARPAMAPRPAATERPAAAVVATSPTVSPAVPMPRPRPADAPGATVNAAVPAPEKAGRAVFDAEADGDGLNPGMFDAAVNAFPAPAVPLAVQSPSPASGAMDVLQAAMFPAARAAPVAPSLPLAVPAAPAATPPPAAAAQAPVAAQGQHQTQTQPQAQAPGDTSAKAEPAPAQTADAAAPALAAAPAPSQQEGLPQEESGGAADAQGATEDQHNAQASNQADAHGQDHAPAAGTAPAGAHGPSGAPGDGHGDGHGTAAAPPRDTRPTDLLRRLQRLQDRLAAGTSEGLPAQRDLISQIDAAYAGFPQEIWQDERNARALAVYFLSGGTPGVLRKILDREPAPAGDLRLLRGILAYAEGRGEEALRFLGEVDARTQPNVLGGQIALAQAALVVRQDPTKASDLLDLARLLLPGTLVEEAALRRQILVESQSPDISRFERLTRQYLFRFRHSVYAGNFRQRFAAALTRMAFVNDPAQFGRLEEMLKPIEPEGRRDIYLLIARAALTQGRTTAAALCAQRTLALAPPASLDAERARLYGAAATAASASGYEAALKTLAAVDRSRLDPSDIALLDAAREAARTVRDASRVSVQPVSAVAPAPNPAPTPALPPTPALAPATAAAPAAVPVAAPVGAPNPVPASTPAVAPSASPPAAAAPPEEPDAVKGARAKLEAVDALLKEAPR